MQSLIHDGSNVKVTMVQMPALNTPQFGWVKSRLPRNPQPVPRSFSRRWRPRPSWTPPTIIAANGCRLSTVEAIVGNKIMPSVGDW